MFSNDAIFPVIRLRCESGFLMLKIPRSDFLEGLFARRRVPEHLRLLDAQQFGGENLFRLRDVGRISLAPAPSALRVNPRNPESFAVFTFVDAVSLLR